jgi:hypothetical protein
MHFDSFGSAQRRLSLSVGRQSIIRCGYRALDSDAHAPIPAQSRLGGAPMPLQSAKHSLETFVFESPNTNPLALFTAFSRWMSETIPSTLPQRRDLIVQTARDLSQRANALIDQACDEQGRCIATKYRRRAYDLNQAKPHADVIDTQELTQSIVHVLRQQSRDEALDYLATLIGGWCLSYPAPLAQPYLANGHDPTDAGMARSLLAWTFRPLDFWD